MSPISPVKFMGVLDRVARTLHLPLFLLWVSRITLVAIQSMVVLKCGPEMRHAIGGCPALCSASLLLSATAKQISNR